MTCTLSIEGTDLKKLSMEQEHICGRLILLASTGAHHTKEWAAPMRGRDLQVEDSWHMNSFCNICTSWQCNSQGIQSPHTSAEHSPLRVQIQQQKCGRTWKHTTPAQDLPTVQLNSVGMFSYTKTSLFAWSKANDMDIQFMNVCEIQPLWSRVDSLLCLLLNPNCKCAVSQSCLPSWSSWIPTMHYSQTPALCVSYGPKKHPLTVCTETICCSYWGETACIICLLAV